MRSLLITISLSVFSFVSCESNPFTFAIGEELVETSTRVSVVDTLSIQLSTVKKDSIVTSGFEALLVGAIQDERFGNITVKSFFQIGLPESYDVDEDEILDSISLILTYNDYFIGDTTLSQSYSIHLLSEELDDDTDGNIYNSTGFNYYPELCGNIIFGPRPKKGGTLEIKLNKELGEEILDYLRGDISQDPSTSDFLKYYRGFVIVPVESECNSVLGFGAADSTLNLKIYTHFPGPMTNKKEYDFPITNSRLQYNQIYCDWSNAPEFASISEKVNIPAKETNDVTYIHNGLGLYTKVSFPTLSKIAGLSELKHSILVRALLYMEPVKMSDWEQETIDELRIYETEKNGDMGSVLLNASAMELTADFYYDKMYHEESYFVFNITSYLGSEIGDFYLEPEFGYYLGFSSSTLASKLDGIVLGGNNHEVKNLKLELIFFYYNE